MVKTFRPLHFLARKTVYPPPKKRPHGDWLSESNRFGSPRKKNGDFRHLTIVFQWIFGFSRKCVICSSLSCISHLTVRKKVRIMIADHTLPCIQGTEAWQSKQRDASLVYFFGGSKTIPIKLIFGECISKMFIYNPWKCRWDILSSSAHMN